jgi:trehalose 6-phosphate phosphatase
VRRLVAAPTRTGLFLDFDGTLAPIVADPTTSQMGEGLAPVITELAARLGLVALLSGRPAAFLADRAPLPGVRLLGLYGLEEWTGTRSEPRPETAAWQEAVDRARERLVTELVDLDGVLLEDKGLSVALHYRNAPDRERVGAAVARVAAAVAAETGLAREPGKLVEELRPPVEWDKGASVRALYAQLGLQAVAYVGDDLGDLAAFAAVRELGGIVVAVDQGPETPPAVLDGADEVVAGTPGVREWLVRVRDALPPRDA